MATQSKDLSSSAHCSVCMCGRAGRGAGGITAIMGMHTVPRELTPACLSPSSSSGGAVGAQGAQVQVRGGFGPVSLCVSLLTNCEQSQLALLLLSLRELMRAHLPQSATCLCVRSLAGII